MNKTWGAVKSAGTTIKNTTQQAAALASNQVKSSVGIKDPSRIEKRITEELHKVFDDTDSFYFCFEHDITNNLQRHLPAGSTDQQTPDERFFWNMHMLEAIMKLNVSRKYALNIHGIINKIFFLFICHKGQNMDLTHYSGFRASRDMCHWQ